MVTQTTAFKELNNHHTNKEGLRSFNRKKIHYVAGTAWNRSTRCFFFVVRGDRPEKGNDSQCDNCAKRGKWWNLVKFSALVRTIEQKGKKKNVSGVLGSLEGSSTSRLNCNGRKERDKCGGEGNLKRA